jgi:hypothetical protein
MSSFVGKMLTRRRDRERRRQIRRWKRIMTKPSQEAERRRVAQIAFEQLLDGKWYARSGLFTKTFQQGRSKHWQYELLKRLLAWNVIEKMVGPNPRHTKYRLTTDPSHVQTARELLTGALKSDDVLTEILWPTAYGVAPGQEGPAHEETPVEDLDDATPTNGDVDIPPEQVIETLLKLMAAVVEKLDRIERSTAKTQEALLKLMGTSTETLGILKQLL